MLFKALVDRECGHNFKLNLNEIVEEFRCIRLDNHCVEGQEYGDLIPPLACCFSKVDPHILAVADEDGGLVIYDTEKVGPRAVLHDWLTHTNAVFDLEWTPSENSLLTASGDQTIVLWDVAEEEKLSTFKSHTSSVKTVQYRHSDKFVFATGSRDGHIMIWDRRLKSKDGAIQPVNILHDAHKCHLQKTGRKKQETHQSVTAVVFQDDHTFLSAGSADGSIKMWDLRRTHSSKKSGPVPKYSFDYAGASIRAHGFSSLVLDSSRTRLFASCVDNVIYQFDCASLKSKPVCSYRGHINSTFYVKTALSPDDRYILSGSSDGNAYIWPVDLSVTSPLALKGHTGEVSGVAWCPADFTKLVTLGDDNSMSFWRLMRRTGLLPKLPDLIGWTERTHREIGISVPSPHCGPLKSPIKGTMLPWSPAKVSSAVRRNLISMTTSTSSADGSTLSSLSISKWVSAVASKAGRSPRKLQVTPKKCAPSIPVSEMSRSSGECRLKERVKRKLCDDIITSNISIAMDNGSATQNKRSKHCGDNMTTVDNGLKKDSQMIVTPLKSDTQSYERTHQGALVVHDDIARKALFPLSERSQDCMCPVSSLVQPWSSPQSVSVLKGVFPPFSPTTHQSPTQGLPNYVLNPEPRTPIGKLPPKQSRTPTWLSKLGEKSSPGLTNVLSKPLSPSQGRSKHSSSPVTPSDGEAVTPRTSGGGRRGATGSRRKAGAQRMLGRRLQCATPPRQTTPGLQGSPLFSQGVPSVSILRYFSPKANGHRDDKQAMTNSEGKSGQNEDVL